MDLHVGPVGSTSLAALLSAWSLDSPLEIAPVGAGRNNLSFVVTAAGRRYLPRLFRLVSLIHREGRRRQGFATQSDVLARVQALLKQEQWLREGGQDLLGGLENLVEILENLGVGAGE